MIHKKGSPLAQSLSLALLALLVMILFGVSACSYGPIDTRPCIIMTTEATEISFQLNGSGQATIYWGGEASETVTFSSDSRYLTSFSSPPLKPGLKTIRVQAEEYTHFDEFVCSGQSLTKLDISNHSNLRYLNCSENSFTILDLSKEYIAGKVDCSNNKLTSLDSPPNLLVYLFDCSNNSLTKLDLSKSNAVFFYCNNNELTSLVLRPSFRSVELHCHSNKLNAEALNALFDKLWRFSGPSGSGRDLFCGGNPGYLQSDKSIAEEKYWIVQEYPEV